VVRTVRGAVLTAAVAVSAFALTPGAAFADAAGQPGKHHPDKHPKAVSVTFNCEGCTIYGDVYSAGKDNIVGNGNGNGNGNDSGNGNGNGNTLGADLGMPGVGIGFPFPNDNFRLDTDGTVRGTLIRTSQEGDVSEYFPYPPFLGPYYSVSVPRVPTKVVYASSGDRGHVTIKTNAERITCDADGNLLCMPTESRSAFDPIRIIQTP
jgi:hypothetical protein